MDGRKLAALLVPPLPAPLCRETSKAAGAGNVPRGRGRAAQPGQFLRGEARGEPQARGPAGRALARGKLGGGAGAGPQEAEAASEREPEP